MPAPFGVRRKKAGTRAKDRALMFAATSLYVGVVIGFASLQVNAPIEKIMQRFLANPGTHKLSRTPSGPRTEKVRATLRLRPDACIAGTHGPPTANVMVLTRKNWHQP